MSIILKTKAKSFSAPFFDRKIVGAGENAPQKKPGVGAGAFFNGQRVREVAVGTQEILSCTGIKRTGQGGGQEGERRFIGAGFGVDEIIVDESIGFLVVEDVVALLCAALPLHLPQVLHLSHFFGDVDLQIGIAI